MLVFLDSIISIRDAKKSAYVVWLDFARAFDSPSHAAIIAKLARIGIADPLLSWLSIFISNRSASVNVGTSSSRTFHISSGVCQGSPLSASIYLLFINDLCQALRQFLGVPLAG